MHYCYIIYSNNRTYNGYTNNLQRRLRQHNGELVGGAKSTRNKGPWSYLLILTCDDWTYNDALSMEWHIRYPTNRKPRPKQYNGIEGRVNSIIPAINNVKLNKYKLYIHTDYIDKIINDNITIYNLNELII